MDALCTLRMDTRQKGVLGRGGRATLGLMATRLAGVGEISGSFLISAICLPGWLHIIGMLFKDAPLTHMAIPYRGRTP